jgi:hypothetical protein
MIKGGQLYKCENLATIILNKMVSLKNFDMMPQFIFIWDSVPNQDFEGAMEYNLDLELWSQRPSLAWQIIEYY